MCFAFQLCATGSTSPQDPLKSVEQLDLERYLGLWYEIARYPQFFQRGCVGSTAEYSFRDDGKIKVLNKCFKGELGGKLKSAEGKAWQPEGAKPSELKVSFFLGLFPGDYWVIDLGEDYEYAVISAPSRKYLWILSRTPRLEESVLSGILARLKNQGFDLSKLIFPEQIE